MSADSNEQLVAQLQEELATLKAQLGDTDLKAFEQIRELRATNKTLTDEVKRLTSEGVQLAFKNRQLDQQARKLQQESSEMVSRLQQESSEMVARLQQESSEMVARLQQESNERVARLQQESAEALARAQEEAQAAIARLQQELAATQERAQTLDHSVEELQGELGLSREQVLSHEAELARQKEELAQGQESMARLQEDLNVRETRISKLERMVNEFKEQFLSGEMVSATVSVTEPSGAPFQVIMKHVDLALGIPGRTLVEQVYDLLGLEKDCGDPQRLEELFDTLQDTGSQLFREEHEQAALKSALADAWNEVGGQTPLPGLQVPAPFSPSPSPPASSVSLGPPPALDSEAESAPQPPTQPEPELDLSTLLAMDEEDELAEIETVQAVPELALPPEPEALEPEPEALEPEPEALESEPEALEPEPEALEPEPEALQPEPEALEPEPEALEPEPGALQPEPEALEPEPEALEPEPEALEPEPEAFEPEPEALEPEPEALEPEPEALEPEPEAFEPEPEAFDPETMAVEPASLTEASTGPLATTLEDEEAALEASLGSLGIALSELEETALEEVPSMPEPPETVSTDTGDWVPPAARAKFEQIAEGLQRVNSQPDLACEMLLQALEVETWVENEAKANLALARLKANREDIVPYLTEALGGTELPDLFPLLSAAESTSEGELAERLGLFYQFGMTPRADLAKAEMSVGLGKRSLNRDFVSKIGNEEEEEVVTFLRDNLIPRAGLQLPVPSRQFNERLDSTGPAAFVGTLRQALRAVDYTLFEFPELRVLTYDGPDHFIVDAASEPDLTLVFHRDIEGMPPEELCFLVFRHLVRMYRGHSQLAHQSAAMDDSHRLSLARAAVELYLEEGSVPHPTLMEKIQSLEVGQADFEKDCRELLLLWYQATDWVGFLYAREFAFQDEVFRKRLDPVADHAAARLVGLTAATYGTLRDELLAQPELIEEVQEGLNELFEHTPGVSHARMRVQRMWNEFLLDG